MRALLFILFSFAIYGCEQDLLVPCQSDVTHGKLCREYRFYNEEPQGFVVFEYGDDSLVVSRIFNTHSELTKTIRQQFRDGKTRVISEQFPDSPSKVQSWHYNDLDSLSLVVFGSNDSSIEITYSDGKRLRESIIIGETVDRFITYRYLESNGKLNRISEFNATDSLTFYSDYNYFDSNEGSFLRVSRFTSQNVLVGRRLFTFSQQGLISSMDYRLADGTLAEEKKYIYDGTGRLIEKTHRLIENTSKSVYLYN